MNIIIPEWKLGSRNITFFILWRWLFLQNGRQQVAQEKNIVNNLAFVQGLAECLMRMSYSQYVKHNA